MQRRPWPRYALSVWEYKLLSDDAALPSRLPPGTQAPRIGGQRRRPTKAARVAPLQARGRRVLVVGGGLNDAGAMAGAHASARLEDATDLAQAVADVVLQGRRLAASPEAVATARRGGCGRPGRAFLALIYNIPAVPAAVAGLVTPLGAALVWRPRGVWWSAMLCERRARARAVSPRV